MDTAVESNELERSWSLPAILTPRRFVNVFSLSRIVLAFLFVTCFQKSASLLYVSIAVCVLALATDLLDGFFARRLRVDSVHGRLWDSLGDKSFYCAVIISFNAQGFLGPTITWALIVREIALYITRILYIQNLPQVERIRPSTNWHGYFMYATIVLGTGQMYSEIHHLSLALTQFVQWSAFAALLFGLFSIFHFIRLR